MAFLTVNGVAYDVLTTGANQEEPEVIGTIKRDWNGASVSSVQAEKRVWSFALSPITEAQWITLYNAIKLGAFVPVGGDAMPGTLSCYVKGTATYVPDALSHKRMPVLKVSEV